MTKYVCAVDVGTRSARAALFDAQGVMQPREVEPFAIHVSGDDIGEYRSADIWAAVCRVVRRARDVAGVRAEDVAGLAFDATCSLVLLDGQGAGVAIGDGGRDTIAWFDRRAQVEARQASHVGGLVIDRLGGAMSPEMQVPKLMWVRDHRPAAWAKLGSSLDLTDWLTSRSIGRVVQSHACLATKWPYHRDAGGWQRAFLDGVGMGDLIERVSLPDRGAAVGEGLGPLTAEAAAALGLTTGTLVGAGLIDGYAGALGCEALAGRDGCGRATAMVIGTSAGLIDTREAQPEPRGLWGPFREVIRDETWCVEGGLTHAGALLDRVLSHWPTIGVGGIGHDTVLGEVEARVSQRGYAFADDLHVLPDPSGMRGTPISSDPGGSIHGLRPDGSLAALAALYWRTAVALALSVEQVLDRFSESGLGSDTLVMSGGLSASPVLTQLFADATGRDILLPVRSDCILLGTAIAASVASGLHGDLTEAGRRMAPAARRVAPNPDARCALARDRAVFRQLQENRELLARL
ncbi:FGGY-family carbohydrate kinase [Maritimibacter sp. UBA3975]|uniref:FGGY-family carbohydrate kinase n=1 Tax=Maritimibacter sp. UBA3975 TaxID=1946833 RepID=UPI0025C569D9|nr:FGGY-family carbohydrate kinase [Maritimibacter sp. UBA3975]|tara:strand:- start:95933 stop:97492 length:1560 start_codon:yes stop_codon:yes gene_type:complete